MHPIPSGSAHRTVSPGRSRRPLSSPYRSVSPRSSTRRVGERVFDAKRDLQDAQDDLHLLENRVKKLLKEESLARQKTELARKKAADIKAMKLRHKKELERKRREALARTERLRMEAAENRRRQQERRAAIEQSRDRLLKEKQMEAIDRKRQAKLHREQRGRQKQAYSQWAKGVNRSIRGSTIEGYRKLQELKEKQVEEAEEANDKLVASLVHKKETTIRGASKLAQQEAALLERLKKLRDDQYSAYKELETALSSP
ncbi:hypothetical protein ADUPG1_011898 [Aduncisulcus paluster]|uniref:Uncharacterized protein n=1 Tax=Aduncisulcus paluster TaxID=2918883 RepID=A0ABQ5K1C7_9EUKA|nr:hypothetical protein ADUPG1_011898 [Aduncisulcus paluster]|eukprot:gnl/Carplike_NY0171/3386_a4558_300.p1 GENE.gnl/Carplike_NY0171/3386_a4558_300~~gnl/Carplike_NY0171/3386_a4558_300.p1  ORF type:complete len:257 (-),score=57.95 gnl/Carplike_NY0171/3386_a4558_300:83-853(-)